MADAGVHACLYIVIIFIHTVQLAISRYIENIVIADSDSIG